MRNKLRDVISYFCENYPHKDELSKARLTKMVYLADWKSAIENDKQLTDIKWVYNHYGPYVNDIAEIAHKDSAFKVTRTRDLNNREKAVLDHIINTTKTLYWNNFIELVYSTYPIQTVKQFDDLDLPRLAKEYKQIEFKS